jgi:hypothetical protein
MTNTYLNVGSQAVLIPKHLRCHTGADSRLQSLRDFFRAQGRGFIEVLGASFASEQDVSDVYSNRASRYVLRAPALDYA